MLYAGLKGVPSYKQDSEVNKLLKRVQLFNVRDSLTHTTSTHSLTHPHTHSLIHSLTTSVRTLPQVANHRVRTYSGGMKRRLSVALAYIGDPQILFLGKTLLSLLSTILSPPPQMSPLQEWM